MIVVVSSTLRPKDNVKYELKNLMIHNDFSDQFKNSFDVWLLPKYDTPSACYFFSSSKG